MCLVSLARITNSDASTASGQRSESLRSRNEKGLSGPSVKYLTPLIALFHSLFPRTYSDGPVPRTGNEVRSDLGAARSCSFVLKSAPTLQHCTHRNMFLVLKLTSSLFRVSVSFGTPSDFSTLARFFRRVFVSYSLRVGEGRGKVPRTFRGWGGRGGPV